MRCGWYLRTLGVMAPLSLSVCSTPYQPEGLIGGYTDEVLGNNRYRITVRGNGYTDLATIKEYFYRRAGEITRARGYDRYRVLALNIDEGDWLTQKPKVIGTIEGYYRDSPPTVSQPSPARSSAPPPVVRPPTTPSVSGEEPRYTQEAYSKCPEGYEREPPYDETNCVSEGHGPHHVHGPHGGHCGAGEVEAIAVTLTCRCEQGEHPIQGEGCGTCAVVGQTKVRWCGRGG
jgi:hypothetical protein